ncbi:protein indeterminate-domain 11-like [Diospyros lotus]|uniref:protein indeterminate-domain 11-like n=1 Tax=Diospyros lotus TaxID=55363 RepID=UPI0022534048|nr:protein indeterminate-domain 11-like [Diospyros lotus]XP_052210388.1 protein indeterminate-domain 11-like [Diospyros lotus]
MNGLILDDSISNLTTSAISSNEASVSSPSQPPPAKKKRNLPGNPDPDAEVVALSPRTLMATNRFICEICNKGFQRDQNLQLHRRGHNLPWKLKQRANKELVKKKVYVCPEPSCVHHEPSRALGDLTGIKKHFSRKHGEKKWKCDKCSKRYAVQSDWKAHSKICGTREYKCDCGTLFSRRDSFITHRAFCDALAAEESSRPTTANNPLQPSSHFTFPPFPLKTEQDQLHHHFNPRPAPPPWLATQPAATTGGGSATHLFSPRLDLPFIPHENPNPSPSPSPTPPLPPFQATPSPHMSATALLQKAAQMGVTIAKPCPSLAASTVASGIGFSSSSEEIMIGSLPPGSGFEGPSFEEALDGMLNPKLDGNFQQMLTKQAMMKTHLISGSTEGGGGDDGLTRDFLGLRAFSHGGLPNMAGLARISSSPSFDQRNQNQAPWQG